MRPVKLTMRPVKSWLLLAMCVAAPACAVHVSLHKPKRPVVRMSATRQEYHAAKMRRDK